MLMDNYFIRVRTGRVFQTLFLLHQSNDYFSVLCHAVLVYSGGTLGANSWSVVSSSIYQMPSVTL